MYEILLEFFRRLPYFFIRSFKFLRKFRADSLVYSESGPNFIHAKKPEGGIGHPFRSVNGSRLWKETDM